MSRPSIGAGFFAGSMSGFTTSGLNPSCFSFSTAGPDAFHKVTVPSGMELAVTFDPAGVDGQLYLLRDCADGSSCIIGEDRGGSGTAESITYANVSGSEQTAYLVMGIFRDVAGIDAFDLLVEIR
jgi:hypothetical protein